MPQGTSCHTYTSLPLPHRICSGYQQSPTFLRVPGWITRSHFRHSPPRLRSPIVSTAPIVSMRRPPGARILQLGIHHMFHRERDSFRVVSTTHQRHVQLGIRLRGGLLEPIPPYRIHAVDSIVSRHVTTWIDLTTDSSLKRTHGLYAVLRFSSRDHLHDHRGCRRRPCVSHLRLYD